MIYLDTFVFLCTSIAVSILFASLATYGSESISIRIANIAPLAFPPYVITVIYDDLFGVFDNPIGAGLMMGLAAYPLLYIFMLSTWISKSSQYNIIRDIFSYSIVHRFKSFVLPTYKKSIIIGSSLVGYEALGDFAVPYYLGVDTISVHIFHLYFTYLDNVKTFYHIGFVFISLILISWYLKTYDHSVKFSMEQSKIPKKHKSNKKILIGAIPVLFGLIIPLVMSIYWSINYFDFNVYANMIDGIVNSSILVLNVFVISFVIAGTLFAFNVFNFSKYIVYSMYALPGIFLPIILLKLFPDLFVPGMLSLSLILALKYSIIPNGVLTSSYGYFVTPEFKKTMNVFNLSLREKIKMYSPRLIISLTISFLLISIETIKEIPITLILQPFGFNTVSLTMFDLIDTELVENIGIISLLIFAYISAINVVIYLIYRKIYEFKN